MNDLLEIRWHGRGGQGVKTAALLLADVLFYSGKYVQGFPEYGPERMGAPVTAYNRISNDKIRVHSNIYEPGYVAVVDHSLIRSANVTKGLKKDGAILINTKLDPEEAKSLLKDFEGKVFTIDAETISIDILGKYFPNMPMLAGIIKMTKMMDENVFLENIETSLSRKFASKPQLVEGNMQVIKRSLEEVKGI
ncbi:MAG: 2-oxoacid:acceptor oxidoreductase family protein [Tissierellia bacterium]|nr:2-oxoacid:acceptor oxidoreductase family protein [Tissierellia bacterium]